MIKSKFLLEYSFVESTTYDSGDCEDILRTCYCTFSYESDSIEKARAYAQKEILPKVIELENKVKYSKSTVHNFDIEYVSHLIEF